MLDPKVDIIIIGAGAAGLMAGIAARGAINLKGDFLIPAKGGPSVLLLESATHLGAKILISGGGRCNVTNQRVVADDFVTDSIPKLRSLLLGFSTESVQAFFTSQGCGLHAEALGKIFPKSKRAADIVKILYETSTRAGAQLCLGKEVCLVDWQDNQWHIRCKEQSVFHSKKLIIATGGKSVPKTGSRGFGYEIAKQFGHELIPTYPALTPLLLQSQGILADLFGITIPVILSLVAKDATVQQVSGKKLHPLARAAGSMLLTHKGISGPAALDVSGACIAAMAMQQKAKLLCDFWTLTAADSPLQRLAEQSKLPGACLPSNYKAQPITYADFMQEMRRRSPSDSNLSTYLGTRLPARLAHNIIAYNQWDARLPLSQISKSQSFKLYQGLVHAELSLAGSEGYSKAEVTSGGVRLSDLERKTLLSKLHPNLYFCGEVVNVTGRLGGFNFQWAWSSGYAAGLGARQVIL